MAFGGGSNETMGVLWKVVGGQKTGGIMVRSGLSLTSTLEDSRLSVGSIVKELAMGNNRLRYELLRGEGPKSGWVSLRLRGIELLIRTKGDHFETEKLGVFRDLGMAPMDFMRSICPNKIPMSHFFKLSCWVPFLSTHHLPFQFHLFETKTLKPCYVTVELRSVPLTPSASLTPSAPSTPNVDHVAGRSPDSIEQSSYDVIR